MFAVLCDSYPLSSIIGGSRAFCNHILINLFYLHIYIVILGLLC